MRLACVVSLVAGWTAVGPDALAEVRKPAFSSEYTTLRLCQPALNMPGRVEADLQGGDVPRRCKGIGRYRIHESYSGASTVRSVQTANGEFSVALLPEAPCPVASYTDPVEWRLRDGRPFAVIASIRCSTLPTYAPTGAASSQPLGEYLVVRGLQGYAIKQDVDVRAVKQANTKARLLADEGYGAP
jgi:hypothetical protein